MDMTIHRLKIADCMLDDSATEPHPALLASIKKHGQWKNRLGTILVTPIGKRYLVVWGRARFRALQITGRKTVRAYIWPNMTAEDLFFERQTTCNGSFPKKMTKEQFLLTVEKVKELGYSQDDFGKIFGDPDKLFNQLDKREKEKEGLLLAKAMLKLGNNRTDFNKMFGHYMGGKLWKQLHR